MHTYIYIKHIYISIYLCMHIQTFTSSRWSGRQTQHHATILYPLSLQQTSACRNNSKNSNSSITSKHSMQSHHHNKYMQSFTARPPYYHAHRTHHPKTKIARCRAAARPSARYAGGHTSTRKSMTRRHFCMVDFFPSKFCLWLQILGRNRMFLTFENPRARLY